MFHQQIYCKTVSDFVLAANEQEEDKSIVKIVNDFLAANELHVEFSDFA